MRKREFTVKCTMGNKYLVRNIINGFYKYNPIGHAGGKGVFDSNILVKEDIDGNAKIRFKCARGKLKECRLTLGRMLNEGLLIGVEEAW